MKNVKINIKKNMKNFEKNSIRRKSFPLETIIEKQNHHFEQHRHNSVVKTGFMQKSCGKSI